MWTLDGFESERLGTVSVTIDWRFYDGYYLDGARKRA